MGDWTGDFKQLLEVSEEASSVGISARINEVCKYFINPLYIFANFTEETSPQILIDPRITQIRHS